MKAAKPKVMPIENADTAYEGTGAGSAHAKQQNKSEKSKEKAIEPIMWEVRAKLDKLDMLFHYEDSFEGGKAKDAIGDFLFNLTLEPITCKNGVKIHPLKKSGKPGKKGKQDCYEVSVGFSCGKFNLYTAKCSNILNQKAAFAKLSTIPSEMVRLGKVDDVFSDTCAIMYHGHNAMSCKDEPVVTARPSRVDLAYDVPVEIDDYLFYAFDVRSTAKMMEKKPSIYLGKNCIFYDKKEQMRARKGLHMFQPCMMRMEVNLVRDKIPVNFPEGLLDAPNPLLKLRPYLKEKVNQWLDQNGYYYLVGPSEKLGLNTVLNGIYLKKRKKILAALDENALPDWWKPEEIWSDMVVHTINHPVVAVFKGVKSTTT